MDTAERVTSIDDVADPATDLTACLEGLAALRGDDFVFALIGGIRNHIGPGEAGTVRARLARRMVADEMARTGATERQAIIAVGERHGYTVQKRGRGAERNRVTGGTMGNFAILVRGRTRASNKPIPGVDE